MYGKLTFTSTCSARIENNHCGLTDRSEKVSPTWERRADRRRDVEVRELPITKARRPQAVLLLCRPVQQGLSDADGGRSMARREIGDERLGIQRRAIGAALSSNGMPSAAWSLSPRSVTDCSTVRAHASC